MTVLRALPVNLTFEGCPDTNFFLLFTVDTEMNQFYTLHKALKRYHDGVFSASYNHYTR